MGAPGFVYVLLNQSLPGCVKIGKTTRDSAARANELSAATGVPTPFLVAYEAFFRDCDQAESYIHALLEADGVRLAGNREFFTISAPQAINMVIQAQNQFDSGKSSSIDGNETSFDDDSNLETDLMEDEPTKPWQDLLEQAEAYLYGFNDVLEDPIKAIGLFKLAAKLGSAEAYIHLGQLHAGSEGLEWLKRGADKGLPECWLELATVFSGEQWMYEDMPPNKANAIKCFRHFFEIIDPISCEYEDNALFFQLARYLTLLESQPKKRDIAVLNNFIPQFRALLSTIPKKSERAAKLRQIDELLEKHHTAVLPADSLAGRIKWFNLEKGYGFITGNDENEYFLHSMNILSGSVSPEDGRSVRFQGITMEQGLAAVNVLIE